MIQGVATTLGQFVDTWLGLWHAFANLLSAFADLGLEGIADAIATYGPATPVATPTTKVLGLVYVVATLAPGFVLVYVSLRTVVDRATALAGAAVAKLLQIVVVVGVLEAAPSPLAKYEAIAYGPVTALRALGRLVATDPAHAFMLATAFAAFVGLSWAMWYGVNLLLYSATLLVRARPVWSESNAKAHALTFTGVWVFFLTLTSAGTAFLQTVLVIGILLVRRSELDRPSLGVRDNRLTESD